MKRPQSYQSVVPADLRPLVLLDVRDDMGHMGTGCTLDLVRARFFWPKMAASVTQKIQTCDRCAHRKSRPEKTEPLGNITPSRPMKLVFMDFLALEPDCSNTKGIPLIADRFPNSSQNSVGSFHCSLLVSKVIKGQTSNLKQ